MKKNVDFNKSISDDWSTPSELYQYFMDRGYIDPCPLNSKVNGLNINHYEEKLFINPPFSKLSDWVDYAIVQYHFGCEVVILMPARTDTKYFHKLLKLQPVVHFFKGRLKFGNSDFFAPFPTILVILSSSTVSHYTFGTLKDFINVVF